MIKVRFVDGKDVSIKAERFSIDEHGHLEVFARDCDENPCRVFVSYIWESVWRSNDSPPAVERAADAGCLPPGTVAGYEDKALWDNWKRGEEAFYRAHPLQDARVADWERRHATAGPMTDRVERWIEETRFVYDPEERARIARAMGIPMASGTGASNPDIGPVRYGTTESHGADPKFFRPEKAAAPRSLNREALEECRAALYGCRALVGSLGNIDHAICLADAALNAPVAR